MFIDGAETGENIDRMVVGGPNVFSKSVNSFHMSLHICLRNIDFATEHDGHSSSWGKDKLQETNRSKWLY